MKKVLTQTLIGLSVIAFSTGCTSIMDMNAKEQPVAEAPVMEAPKAPVVEVKDPNLSKMDIQEMDAIRENPFLTVSAVGEGVAPVSTISPAQAIALAKRAAIADAYRQLGEKIYGVKINAKDTVKDAALQNSRITTSVDAVVRNAQVVETSYQDGLYQVAMELKVSKKTWRSIFAF